MSLDRIRKWIEYWDGNVFFSFSGGKDSWALANMVWSIDRDIRACHVRTGLEYPEINQFVNEVAQSHPVVILHPKMSYADVIKKYGYPIGSKKVSRELRILGQEKDNPKWKNTYHLYDTGYKKDGTFSKGSKLSQCWRKCLSCGFKFSEQCCDIIKKNPLDEWQKNNGNPKRMTGIMADEGGLRAKRTECSIFESRDPNSAPMLFWKTEDVWNYLRNNNL